VKTQRPQLQRCTSLASLPRFKLCLEICAGGVHDQLWQKNPVEETAEIENVTSKFGDLGITTRRFWAKSIPSVERELHCVDYLAALGENE